MSQRTALYALAARHRLDAPATRRLFDLAGLEWEPAALDLWLPRGVALLAAALVGLGLVLWVAANWDSLGRVAQFALLQGAVLAGCLGALAIPASRSAPRQAAALLAMLAIGGLLAYFGQTYQTGADPWQLFAWWGLLALPLALALRSDALWTPWALVAMTAVALWSQAHAGRAWFWSGAGGADDLKVYTWAWGGGALIVVGLSPVLRPLTGAGLWSLRTAATLAVALVTFSALLALFGDKTQPTYWLGLLALALAALVLALPGAFEIGVLSAVALGLDTLLVAGLGRWLLEDHRGGDPIAQLFVLGLAAAGLLAASVAALLRLARRYGGAQT